MTHISVVYPQDIVADKVYTEGESGYAAASSDAPEISVIPATPNTPNTPDLENKFAESLKITAEANAEAEEKEKKDKQGSTFLNFLAIFLNIWVF